jgi:hypothetical protein
LPLLIAALVAGFPGGLRCGAAPEPAGEVPAEVLRGAEAATKILGAQVLKGNLSYSIQRMYPRWRKRAAVREGGDAALEKKLMDVFAQARKQGTDLLAFEVGEAVSGHEVHLGRGTDEKTGKDVERYLEWLVFVPTRKIYRVIDPATGEAKKLEMKGYQVAIVKKRTSDWYFIDGSSLTIPELRSFFPGLPEDQALLGLPPVHGSELKN